MIYPSSLTVKSIILTVTQIKEGGNPNNSNKAAEARITQEVKEN
jgi:hypothetical protein